MLLLTDMFRISNTALVSTLAAIALIIFTPPLAQAAQFQPMVGIPGLSTTGNYTFVDLVNRLYIFLIAIGAVIGVIKIALAGVKWATSSSGSSISDAKEDIKGVLLGLIILMVPYIVLSIINPQFANLNVLTLKPLPIPAGQSSGGNSGNGGSSYSPVPSQTTVPAGYVRSGSPCFEKRPDEVGKCNAYGHSCISSSGTVVHSTVSEAGGSTLYNFQCYKPPVGQTGGNDAPTKSCGTCVAAPGDDKCLAFENACAAVGGTANPVRDGDVFKSTCTGVPQSAECPNPPTT